VAAVVEPPAVVEPLVALELDAGTGMTVPPVLVETTTLLLPLPPPLDMVVVSAGPPMVVVTTTGTTTVRTEHMLSCASTRLGTEAARRRSVRRDIADLWLEETVWM